MLVRNLQTLARLEMLEQSTAADRQTTYPSELKEAGEQGKRARDHDRRDYWSAVAVRIRGGERLLSATNAEAKKRGGPTKAERENFEWYSVLDLDYWRT